MLEDPRDIAKDRKAEQEGRTSENGGKGAGWIKARLLIRFARSNQASIGTRKVKLYIPPSLSRGGK